MSWIRRIWERKRLEQELDKELQFHLERQTQDLIAGGVEPREARRRAALAFGGIEQTKEACRDARGVRWLEDFFADCRYGARLLSRSPVFACAAVMSLALGIGANTAIFSLMDLVMLRMIPVREPGRLVQFQKVHPTYGRGSISYPLFEQFQHELQSFEGLLAHSFVGRRELSIGGQAEEADIELVSGSYYSVLGVSAWAGRTFTTEVDAAPGGSPVAVISNGYWKRRFGSNPSAIGATFQLNRTVFTIIGVTPPEFFGVFVGHAPDITLPLGMDAVARGESWLGKPDFNWLSVMGRLRNGQSLAQAKAEVKAIFARIAATDASRADTEQSRKVALAQRMELEPAGNGFDELRHQFSEPLAILMGVVALVLLIACANLANLLLAKSAARRREIAVRLAIGAGRGRLIRQLLTEGLLLSAVGGAFGVLLAYWLGNGLVTMMSNGGPRMALAVRPDTRVLAFASLVSLLACLLFSLAPAIQATRLSVQPALAEIRAGRWRLGKGLIVAQVAISLLLLIGAGLFGRSLLNMYSLDAGFDRRGVLLFSVNTAKAGYKGRRVRDLQERILTELKTLPGVSSASLALLPPLSGGGWDGTVYVEGYTYAPEEDNVVHLNAVGPHFFRTLNTPVVLGREFDERDTPASPNVAVVNQTFARYYFNGRSPIGKWISTEGPNRDPVQIVGVVKNVKYRDLRQNFPRTVYFAALQSAGGPDWHSYVVRAARPANMTGAIAAALRRIDKGLRITESQTLEEHVARTILLERMMATLAGSFSALALAVACVGIYGVMAFQVARRRKELGIRLALGASPHRVIAMILGQAAGLLAAGCALGIAAALLLTRVAAKTLFGIKPTDAATFALAAGVLTVAAIAAAYLPGRSAAKLNPAETLRCD
jgi:predicted permease